jgi:putative tricarboxylic transport membrane protein
LTSQPDLVWGLIASLYIANIMLLLLNLPLVGLWARVLHIPKPYLFAGILIFAIIGTYGISQSFIDLVLLLAIGIIGFFMRLFDFPTSPVIIGMILGPMAEQEFRRAMITSQGDMSVFITHPLSAALLGLAVFAVVTPHILRLIRSKNRNAPF